PTSAASTTTPPKIASRCTFGFASPFGVSFSSGTSSTAGRALAAFSSPTSISTLIVPSLRVHLFHLPNRTRIVRARLIEAVKRRNLVVVRTRQRILRLDHFNIVRHPRLEPVPRLIHLFLRKLHTQIRHGHLAPRRIQI